MKSLRLLAVALFACAFAASAAFACDAHKSAKGSSTTAATTASVSSASKTPGTVGAGCSAEAITYKKTSGTSAKAAACTPAMQAACESNPSVAAAMGCTSAKGTTASTASSSSKSSAKMDGCCATKGAKASTATVTASNSKSMSADHCADAKSTSAVAAGMNCTAHASAMAHDCSACEDWMTCEQEVRSLGAKAQVVPLKNGAMIVYTAESPGEVKAVQTAISKRHEKMLSALSGTSGKTLCDECKSLRGATASGKLHREVVNVDKGCMTLITSNDKAVVTKIHAMTGQQVAMR